MTTMREAQLKYVVEQLQRAEAGGHALQLESFQNAGRQTLSYRARCSCGWEQRKSSSQTAALVQVVSHVGLVLGDLDAQRDEARRVGLNLPATVTPAL